MIISGLQYHFTFALWGPDIFLSTLFSKTVSVFSSLSVRYQVQVHRKYMRCYRSVYFNLLGF